MPKAYVPISDVSYSYVGDLAKVTAPNYPDIGVAYAGYSKKLLSENQYKILFQTPFDSNSVHAPTGPVGGVLLTLLTTSGFYYIKDIILSFLLAANTRFDFFDAQNGRMVLTLQMPAGLHNEVLKFDVPIKVTQTISVLTTPNVNVGDIMCYNFFGWIETE